MVVYSVLRIPTGALSSEYPDEKGIHNPQFFSWENTGSMEFSICRCRQTSIEQFRPQDPTLVSQTTRNGQARAGTPSILYAFS